MTQFFLNILDGAAVLPDREGVRLSGVETVESEALRDVRKILAEGDASGYCRRHWTMEVTDEAGQIVFSLPFSHALRPDRLQREAPDCARRP